MQLTRTAICAIGISALVLVTGCGSSGSSTGGSSSSGGSSAKLADFDTKVAADVAKAQKPVTERPPSGSPPAQTGKSIFVIGCSFQAEGCVRPSKGAHEAAGAIGWKSTLIDTGGDPTKAGNAIRQAISEKASGVIINAFDSSTLAAPLAAARAAGLKTVGMVATNEGGGFDAVVPGTLEPDGYIVGEQAYLQSGKDLKLLLFSGDEYGVVRQRVTGTERFIKDCQAAGGKCQLLGKQDIISANLGTTVPGQAATFARSHPDFNIVYTPYDGAASFLKQGLKQSGIDLSKSSMVGFDSNLPNLDDIRNNGYEKATMGFPLEWLGYQGVDDMNRLLAGQTVPAFDTLKKLITKANVQPSGAWEGDFPGFRDAYKQSWGR
jgi:ribose transport system substrate-binding protein